MGSIRVASRCPSCKCPSAPTRFNTRTEAAGFPWATSRWDGSFVPFPRTEAERRASGDSRRSLEARYAHRADYVGKVNRAATAVADKGFLLPEEVDALIREAGELYDRVTAPGRTSCTYVFGD